METFGYLQEDYPQKGDTKREEENMANKMQELEFAFMLIILEEILQYFHRVSQVLQNDCLHASRNEHKTIEEAANEIIPGVNHKATRTLIHKRKWSVMEMYLRCH